MTYYNLEREQNTSSNNALLENLEKLLMHYESQMKMPQEPALHRSNQKMYLALQSAIEIIKKTNTTELTQKLPH